MELRGGLHGYTHPSHSLPPPTFGKAFVSGYSGVFYYICPTGMMAPQYFHSTWPTVATSLLDAENSAPQFPSTLPLCISPCGSISVYHRFSLKPPFSTEMWDFLDCPFPEGNNTWEAEMQHPQRKGTERVKPNGMKHDKQRYIFGQKWSS